MARDEKVDRALDAALEMTFPASDPIAVYTGEPRPREATAKAKTRAETSSKTERAAPPARTRRESDRAVASIA
jgi:hypothetical protein